MITDERLGQFHAAMKATNWEPVRDIFGNIVNWRHSQTDRIETNKRAYEYWSVSGDTPTPF